jgi:glutamate dehydrogenase (NAD(P)+)
LALHRPAGAVFNSKGLNVEALKKHQEKAGTLLGFAGAERELDAAHAMDLMETECDILIPAALEKQINMHNAARVRAKIIAEGANGPVTPFAEDILAGSGR